MTTTLAQHDISFESLGKFNFYFHITQFIIRCSFQHSDAKSTKANEEREKKES